MPDADSFDSASPEKSRKPESRGHDSSEAPTSEWRGAAVLHTQVVVFVEGREILRRILTPGRYLLGRAARCHLCFDAPGVADLHACLSVGEDGALLLEDLAGAADPLNSGQTTRVPTPIEPGQSIQIGAVRVLVQQSMTPIEGNAVTAGTSTLLPSELASSSRYELGPEIARGGMGAVLSARQPAIRRQVAVKVMLRETRPDDRLRFVEEAQITGQLEHPNIVPVHELATNERGQPYYTMKLVQGRTLKDIIKLLAEGDTATVAKYPLAALLTIFQKVCDAVAFAHAKGVIHRDIKPANIMIGDYGEVLVMDWGLAKVIPGTRSGVSPSFGIKVGADSVAPATVDTVRDDRLDPVVTLDGVVMGTPKYMSPEQARGEVATLDERSDVFSLGAILYELATLSPPFSGKTVHEILYRMQSGHLDLPNARLRAAGPERPHHLPAGSIPESLEAVIVKALAIERDRRYRRVADLQADLTAFQNGFATSAEHAGAWRQFILFLGRKKELSAAIAASLLLIAVLTGVFTVRVVKERDRTAVERDRALKAEHTAGDERDSARQAAHEAQDQRAAAEAARHDAERNLYLASMGLCQSAWEASNLTGLRRAVAEMRGYPHRGFEWYYWQRQVHSELRVLPGHVASVTAVAFSPDGRKILTGSEDETVKIWDTETGREIRTIKQISKVIAAAFSPDGKRIITAVGAEHGADSSPPAKVWDAETGAELLTLMQAEDGQAVSVCYSPDGRRIATGAENGTVLLWDAKTGRKMSSFTTRSYVSSIAFSPNGRRLLTGCSDQVTKAIDADTGRELLTKEQIAQSQSITYTTVGGGKTVTLWDADTGRELRAYEGHAGKVNAVTFSTDGRWLATGGDDKTARIWDVETGHSVRVLQAHLGAVKALAFSPDASQVITASEDQTMRIWDAKTGRELRTIRGHEGPVRSLAVSSDGQRIISGSDDETARLWDARVGAEPLTLQGHDQGVSAVSFSLDGRRMVTGGGDETAVVWDLATGRKLHSFKLDGTFLRVVAVIYPDGRRIVTNTGTEIKVWDVETGRELFFLRDPARQLGLPYSGATSALALSADGRRIITSAGEMSATVWDGERGGQLLTLAGHTGEIFSIAVSADGRRIVTGGEDKTAKVWDGESGHELLTLRGHESSILAVAISADGQTIVTSDNAGTAKVWDARSGRELLDLHDLENEFAAVALSSDGQRVVTSGKDKTVMIWDTVTGRKLLELRGHDERVISVAISADGQRIASGDWQGTARVWSAASPTEAEAWQRADEAREHEQKRKKEYNRLMANAQMAGYEKHWQEAASALAAAEKLASEEDRLELDQTQIRILLAQKNYAAAAEVAARENPSRPEEATRMDLKIATAIVNTESSDDTALALAEKLAARASASAQEKDPAILEKLARILFRRGKKQEAIQVQEKALTAADKESKKALQKTLDDYRQGILPMP